MALLAIGSGKLLLPIYSTIDQDDKRKDSYLMDAGCFSIALVYVAGGLMSA